ncbi:hypothetical protein F5Y16DRAFT_76772 [Xylariaceae sp. FL0255]|nr:hypothetical protein F5Y16DRAFT_76772 [Xylariaceae sp. FL0255]
MGPNTIGLALSHGNFRIIKFMIEEGVNFNLKPQTEWGKTPLEMAAENGNLDLVRLLLEMGARIDKDMRIYYVRSIQFALRFGHRAVANHLREYGLWTEGDELLQNRPGLEDNQAIFRYNPEIDDWHIILPRSIKDRYKNMLKSNAWLSVDFYNDDDDDDSEVNGGDNPDTSGDRGETASSNPLDSQIASDSDFNRLPSNSLLEKRAMDHEAEVDSFSAVCPLGPLSDRDADVHVNIPLESVAKLPLTPSIIRQHTQSVTTTGKYHPDTINEDSTNIWLQGASHVGRDGTWKEAEGLVDDMRDFDVSENPAYGAIPDWQDIPVNFFDKPGWEIPFWGAEEVDDVSNI